MTCAHMRPQARLHNDTVPSAGPHLLQPGYTSQQCHSFWGSFSFKPSQQSNMAICLKGRASQFTNLDTSEVPNLYWDLGLLQRDVVLNQLRESLMLVQDDNRKTSSFSRNKRSQLRFYLRLNAHWKVQLHTPWEILCRHTKCISAWLDSK